MGSVTHPILGSIVNTTTNNTNDLLGIKIFMSSCIMVPGVLESTCGTYKIYQDADPYTPVTMMRLLANNLSLAIYMGTHAHGWL